MTTTRVAPTGDGALRRATAARREAGRRITRALDRMGYGPQPPTRRPCDYMMTDDERIAYARYLMDTEHWQQWEVRAVLTAPGVRDAA